MLSPLEVAAGVSLPRRIERAPLPRTSATPREALEQASLLALRRPPCVVSFSGGRDSSLVLAVATTVARREGLPLPVPLTVRIAGDAESDEQRWQEVVIKHLGLDDWVRVELGDDFDCIGPLAQRVLRRHGVLSPPNLHFHLPQFEAAAGGSVLTGIAGDEAFLRSSWLRLRRVLGGRARPEPRDGLRVAAALSPRWLRREVLLRREDLALSWLTPDARHEVYRRLADEAVTEPFTWRRRFEWLAGLSYLTIGIRSLDLLAADADTVVHHPLFDPLFLGSLAALPRRQRFESRTQAMTSLFADLLPPEVLSRTSKAAFEGALWGKASRAFAEQWDGSDVDESLVDVDALEQRWRRDRLPGPHTLLQAIWLSRQEGPSTPNSRSSASGSASQLRGRRSSQAGSVLS